ncbi:hypothetical protein M408DRAFT_198351 [Serendipita vermifera MAFF 305830]|uniref:Uncharacterized protein n=1 Tax=Serendipita vermifera MAFF 305830 TaxID=933852 RepID=A0A0C3B1C7_SERVB|nr:hypothetical protein M408DRAFT_198351 [Serendipita vermifera MAFF 305830]
MRITYRFGFYRCWQCLECSMPPSDFLYPPARGRRAPRKMRGLVLTIPVVESLDFAEISCDDYWVVKASSSFLLWSRKAS